MPMSLLPFVTFLTTLFITGAFMVLTNLVRNRGHNNRWAAFSSYHKRSYDPESPSEISRQLLVDHLNKAQRETFTKYGYFDVVLRGRHRGRYRITTGQTYLNIYKLRAWSMPSRYCVTASHWDYLPSGDIFLAQLLLLSANPRKFFEIARKS